MRADAHERLRAAIERKNAERGRPLTASEKLANLDREIGTDLLGELARAKAAFQLRAIEAVIRGPASVDTRPEGGDSTKIEAPFTGGAVPHEDAADAQMTPPSDKGLR